MAKKKKCPTEDTIDVKVLYENKIEELQHQSSPQMFNCYTGEELESFLQNNHWEKPWRIIEGTTRAGEKYIQVLGPKSIIQSVHDLGQGVELERERNEVARHGY